MSINAANQSAYPWAGYLRTTVDVMPQHPMGVLHVDGEPDASYRLGRRIGENSWTLDIKCKLAPGQRRAFDLSQFDDAVLPALTFPADLVASFGAALPTVNGTPMVPVTLPLQADGAAWLLHARAKVPGTRMLVADLWLWWMPEQPWFCHGEVMVTCSNPDVPDMGELVTSPIHIAYGDAKVTVLGAEAVVDAGVFLADGESCTVPVTLVWLSLMPRTSDAFIEAYLTAEAAKTWHVGAVGITQMLAEGNPTFPEGFDVTQWIRANIVGAISRMHTFDPSPIGPAKISSGAGRQEDQLLHPGAEALLPLGVGAERIRQFVAFQVFSHRPCNHLEADGSPLNPALHPRLLFWDGRAHWHTGVSPDRLGKPRNLLPEEAHGYWGPDVQHFYQRTLAAPARLTGSPGCQRLLSNHARVYLLQRTVNLTWSTSGYESAREWGCEAQIVMDFWRDLEDRQLAQQCKDRWISRVRDLLIPLMVGKDLIKVFDKDPRVNPTGLGAQWWQESFAADRIDMACATIGPVEGREVAQRIARNVLDVAWRWYEGTSLAAVPEAVEFVDGELQAIHEEFEANKSKAANAVEAPHWRSQPQGPVDGSANEGNPSTDSFNDYGMPMCVACVLRSEPTNVKARAIWTQLLTSTAPTARRWMPPLVLQ